MKRILLFLIFVPHIVPAQVSESKMVPSEKYFHYRERLVNEFMLGVGNDFGHSIPAMVSNTFDKDYRGESTIKWSDATIELSYYIGVLSMEYLLLSKQNRPVEQTLKELYYALEAMNRLDYYGDEYYGSPPALNGFFVRSDVGKNLFNAKNKNEKYSQSMHRLAIDNSALDNAESEWINMHLYNDKKRFAISKDQVFHLLLAMRLITKCLPPGISYGNSKFRDGELLFVKEAGNITDRMMNWIHPQKKSNFITNWRVRQPNGKKVGAGYNAWSFAYGMSLAQQKISGTKNPAKSGVSWWFAKAAYNFTWLAFKPIYFFNQSEGTKTLNLVLINSKGRNDAGKVYRYSYFSEKYPNYHIPLLFGFLNGRMSDKIDKGFYEKLFHEAPDEGPHYLRSGLYKSFNWSSTSLIVHPERRGRIPAHFPGRYNGIDYMFLYNLYLLCYDKVY